MIVYASGSAKVSSPKAAEVTEVTNTPDEQGVIWATGHGRLRVLSQFSATITATGIGHSIYGHRPLWLPQTSGKETELVRGPPAYVEAAPQLSFNF